MKKLLILSLLLAVVIFAGCQEIAEEEDNLLWKCIDVQCAEVETLDGAGWAQQNCQITEQGTLCAVAYPDGTQDVVPIENINLSSIQTQQCTKFVCIEEIPYRVANYTLNLTQ